MRKGFRLQYYLLKKYLSDAFVMYKPKDVVSGDFYWMSQENDEVIFAVADCTGHGVPGALMSVVCHNTLSRSVNEFKLKKPSDILNKTRDFVIEALSGKEDYVNDGMDISLCNWNKKNQ